MTEHAVSAVICTYNRCDLLKRALVDFMAQDGLDQFEWELIVVDNRSKDKTRQVVEGAIEEHGSRIRYVYEENQGLNHARNRGAREAQFDAVMYTDDDVYIDKKWLINVATRFAQPDIDAIGGRVLPIWECEKPDWFIEEGSCRMWGVIVQHDNGEQIKWIESGDPLPIGANMGFRKSVFERFGYFDVGIGAKGDDLANRMGDEIEFLRAIVKAGCKLSYEPNILIHHTVPEERLDQTFLKRYYFNYGKYEAKSSSLSHPRKFMRVPLFVYRELFGHIVGWFAGLIQMDKSTRFYHVLHYKRLMGKFDQFRSIGH